MHVKLPETQQVTPELVMLTKCDVLASGIYVVTIVLDIKFSAVIYLF